MSRSMDNDNLKTRLASGCAVNQGVTTGRNIYSISVVKLIACFKVHVSLFRYSRIKLGSIAVNHLWGSQSQSIYSLLSPFQVRIMPCCEFTMFLLYTNFSYSQPLCVPPLFHHHCLLYSLPTFTVFPLPSLLYVSPFPLHNQPSSLCLHHLALHHMPPQLLVHGTSHRMPSQCPPQNHFALTHLLSILYRVIKS